eukprot:TRINITY_DN29528_c0_g1_i4.p1 TRINITY_DN29528_c0_g1~~TRINITY_DN29528_c0_g1_i4.p1  ORF type:complete len:359 (-),score=73.75 TRINITY_DN29528_c0_g1_i4:105-1181(-)
MTSLRICLSAVAATVANAVAVLQWKPHWECFKGDRETVDTCKPEAEASLDEQLTQYDVDFANVIGLEDDAYQPPGNFKKVSSACGIDVTTLFYNAARWQLLDEYVNETHSSTACLGTTDKRPALARLFASSSDDNIRVLVVGADFPHGDFHYSPLTEILMQIMESSGSCSAIFMADTSKDKSVTSQKIFESMLPDYPAATGTDPQKTCCARPPGFVYTFDRIITNANGSKVQTTLLHEPLPPWVDDKWNFHKGLLGRFDLERVACPAWFPTTTSTTTTTTSMSQSGSTTSAQISGSGDGGPPLWAWLLFAVGVLLVFGATVVLFVSPRRPPQNARAAGQVRELSEVDVDRHRDEWLVG